MKAVKEISLFVLMIALLPVGGAIFLYEIIRDDLITGKWRH